MGEEKEDISGFGFLKKVKNWKGPLIRGYLAELTPWCMSFLHKHCSEYWKQKG